MRGKRIRKSARNTLESSIHTARSFRRSTQNASMSKPETFITKSVNWPRVKHARRRRMPGRDTDPSCGAAGAPIPLNLLVVHDCEYEHGRRFKWRTRNSALLQTKLANSRRWGRLSDCWSQGSSAVPIWSHLDTRQGQLCTSCPGFWSLGADECGHQNQSEYRAWP